MSKFSLLVLASYILLAPLPALADHAGVSAGPGSTGAIITSSARTMPQGKIGLGFTTEYSSSKRFSNEQLVEFASNHIHAHSTDFMLTNTLTAAYGISDNLMISLRLPYIYRENIRSGNHSHAGGVTTNTVDDNGGSGAPGDALVIGKYRFLRSRWFDSALMIGVEMPTGESSDTHKGEKLEAENQGGSGSWDPVLGVAFSHQFGSYGFDASILYKLATVGAQDTNLGDRASYGIALTKRLGGELHEHGGGEIHTHEAWDLVLEYHAEWYGKEEAHGERDDDGGGTTGFISPGIRYTSDMGWNTHVSVGVPVRHDLRRGHPDSDIKVTAGIGFAF